MLTQFYTPPMSGDTHDRRCTHYAGVPARTLAAGVLLRSSRGVLAMGFIGKVVTWVQGENISSSGNGRVVGVLAQQGGAVTLLVVDDAGGAVRVFDLDEVTVDHDASPALPDYYFELEPDGASVNIDVRPAGAPLRLVRVA